MPDVCVAALCNNTHSDKVSLHLFPKSKALRDIWTKFVQDKRDYWDGPSSTSRLCSAHFAKDQFVNLGMFKARKANKLLLKRGAVPTNHTGQFPVDDSIQDTNYVIDGVSGDNLGKSSDQLVPPQRKNSAAARKRQVLRVSMGNTFSFV